jgi:hypothetical protein
LRDVRTTTGLPKLPTLLRFELVTAIALLAVADGRRPHHVADRVLAREPDPRRAAIARPFLLVMAAAVPGPDDPSDADEALGQSCLDAMADAWDGAHVITDGWEIIDVLFSTYRAVLTELGDMAGMSPAQAHQVVRAVGESARQAALAG